MSSSVSEQLMIKRSKTKYAPDFSPVTLDTRKIETFDGQAQHDLINLIFGLFLGNFLRNILRHGTEHACIHKKDQKDKHASVTRHHF